jgi:restriction system protein
MAIPKFDNLYNPVVKALHLLGGSGSVSEIEERVIELVGLSERDANEIHKGGTTETELNYRLAWARTYLKIYGVLENSSRGVWVLTAKGQQLQEINKEEVNRVVRAFNRNRVADKTGVKTEEIEEREWQDEMLEELLKLKPSAFEKLCQRILREAGFIQVEVTGRSGDGGIDGRGIIKIGGMLSFHIIFQCKRYRGSVSAQQIRDFRGAMVGRADKGLFITTGTFTRDARHEASRDGAPPIDLIEGTELVEKMKELDIGVKVKSEETVEIDKEWFKNF